MKNKDQWRKLLRQNLSSFIARSFMTVNPVTEYVHNWHIDLIAEYLKACANGDVRRLIINMPPRAMKSLCISVAWPAWLLGHNPGARIIVSSYSRALAVKHSLDSRLILKEDWYKYLFPDTELSKDQKEKTKYLTTKRGFRLATATGATLTGEGGNFLIVDDPINAVKALSDKARQKTIDWFEQAFMSRLDDKKKGIVVIVMQRLHQDDLAGHLLKKGGWDHLCLPALFESRTELKYGTLKKVVKKGEILHEGLDNLETLDRVKLDLGSYAFAAQYQQNPIPREGGIIKKEWIRFFDKLPEALERIVQSWDTAIKASNNNDYSVCTTWGVLENAYYLIDVFRKQMEYPELKATLIRLAEAYNPSAILIEDKASGQSLIQDLKRESRLPIVPIKVNQDKIIRMSKASTLFEAGKITIPIKASWKYDYETELLHFPSSANDDQIDSTSQALNWLNNKKAGPNIRWN